MSDRDAAVLLAIRRTSNLPGLSAAAQRIIERVNAPDVSLAELTALIEPEPEIAMSALRMVNSAFYGQPGRVSSIQRAVTLLGVRGVRTVAIVSRLSRMLDVQATGSFSASLLWTHSENVAMTARALASRLRDVDGDDAFVAGLLHDIGYILELSVDRRRFATLVTRTQGGEQDQARQEVDLFGASHEEFGGGLCQHWGLPEQLTAAVANHHVPLQAPLSHRRLAAVVYVADRVAHAETPAFSLNVAAAPDPEVLQFLGVSPETLAAVVAQVRDTLVAREGSRPTGQTAK